MNPTYSFGVQATNPKPELRITNDLDKTSSDTIVGTTDLPTGWNYVVYCVEIFWVRTPTLPSLLTTARKEHRRLREYSLEI
jgi:hypothetical protein